MGRAINLDGAEVSCNPPCLHRRKRPKTIILGGYSGLQVTGMMEGFLGFFEFEIFDFGIFWGSKVLASIFWVALFK